MTSKGDFWIESTAAQRYREARPYFHPVVMELIRERIGIQPGERLLRGVDVGCGTGQSTVALLDLVESAVGIDSSEQMLAHAERRDRVEYLPGTAEQLPVESSSAEIVTASLATHWFDMPAFLDEAARVLRPGGWLATYSNGFRGQMVGNPSFHDWSENSYLARYPSPPRPHYDPPQNAFTASQFDLVTDEHTSTGHADPIASHADPVANHPETVAKQPGFTANQPDTVANHLASTASHPESTTGHPEPVEGWQPQPYTNEIIFSPEQLVAYLMTQSNVIAKVEQGTEAADDVKEWLTDEVRQFFTSREETFMFGGAITLARLTATGSG